MTSKQIIACLEPFVSEHKRALVERISGERTRHITLVFEDIDKPHNISAVLRSAECMGVQDLHFIKNQNDYQVNPDITQGAAKWMTLYHHNSAKSGTGNIEATYDHLRRQGYRIYATSIGSTSQKLEEIDASQKMAVVFGTEGTGISKEAANQADGLIQIPMKGFTESFNLSVSAALIMNALLKNYSADWALSELEREALIAEWYRKIVRESDLILARHKRLG